MVNRLTITPSTDYTHLTESQKELFHRAHDSAAMVSMAARGLYPADNVDGVDLDPAVGKIHIQGRQEYTFVDQKLEIKDPAKKEFDLKNINSFEMVAVNGLSGEFAKMTLKNGTHFDADGDGKAEKGMMCTIQGGIADQNSRKVEIQSATQVFFNDDIQSITILEQAPNPA